MRRLLRYAFLATLVAAPAAAQDSTVVVLVRHAEKAPVEGNDPPLSEAGEARATALAQALNGMHFDAVIATERQRTQLTARPLAQRDGLTPEIVGLGSAHVDSVAAAVRRHAGHTVLVVGHSNTVPRIVHALGGPQMRDLCEPEFSHLYVMVLKDGAAPRLEERTYGAADPPGAGNCPPSP
ncbi:phosphoglycerate mutase family protein [Longimicrobium sp.]|uniref:SixA phosphatase family protein n=1 Tax=Longimicrobium sp. TaxID=2029185 RepID=UPI002E333A00|nr:phosphoglycerate mutase family protein [Longimicrobium sp.]HEX6041437.1 phosphoglycerate mutase family protein [Longimicrobium sp.]